MLNTILSSLGLTDEEVKMYVMLLESGPVPASMLAKKAGIPRSSLYGHLRRLHAKGLVNQTLRLGIKVFAAEPPDRLLELFKERIEALSKDQAQFRALLPSLKYKKAADLVRPRFQLFEGSDGVRHVLKDMLLYHDLETIAFWPIKSMLEVLGPEFFRSLNKERIKNNLYTRAIWPRHQVVNVKKHPYLGIGPEFRREIRIAPQGIDFAMGYWVYGNKAAFISSQHEGFGFIIESAELVAMLRAQFEVMWNLCTPLIVNPQDTALFLKEL